MKVIHDQDTDTLTFVLRECMVAESEEVREGGVIDTVKAGIACAIEILDVAGKVSYPKGIDCEMEAKWI